MTRNMAETHDWLSCSCTAFMPWRWVGRAGALMLLLKHVQGWMPWDTSVATPSPTCLMGSSPSIPRRRTGTARRRWRVSLRHSV
jgi:hypothetical protein